MQLRLLMHIRGFVSGVLLVLAVSAAIARDVPIGQPEASQVDFIGWATERAIALESNGSSFGRAGAEALRTAIGDARVVALGEPAHGAHEPLAFRNQLFSFLVEELGFTAIALESGVSESRRLYDYAMGGFGDAEHVVRDGFTWGFGDYPENVELLRWVRQYNDHPTRERKIRVYGIDLSGGVASELTNARIALDNALAFLLIAAPEASTAIRNALIPWLEHFERAGFALLTQTERRRLGEAINGLLTFLEAWRTELTDATSPVDYDWASRNAVVARQLERMFQLWPMETPKEGVSAEMHGVVSARDSAMADNVLWALEREGPQGRILVFAHNAHVMNAPLRGGAWDVFPIPVAMMGRHLQNALGDDLLIVGTSSGEIGSGFPVRAGSAGSMDVTLGQIGPDHFLIDFRGAQPQSTASSWLREMQTLRANLATELQLVPREAFDAVVYFGHLTPSEAEVPRR